MPSTLPDGDPAPRPASCLRLGPRDPRRPPVRHLPPRAVLLGALRLLRLQHLHAHRARRRGRRPRRPSPTRPLRELDLAGEVLGDAAPGRSRPSSSAAARPRCCRAADLVRCVDGIRDGFGLAPDAEVTTEANPDSVTAGGLEALAAGGFTRVSIGMQSAVPHVLRDPRAHPRPGPRRHRRRRRRGPPGSRPASTSSTARRGRASTTGGPASTRPSRSSPTTSPPTRSSSRRAPSWPPRCVAARCRRPRTTTRPTSTSWPTSVLAAAGLRLVRGEQLVARRPQARCRHNEGYWAGGDWWGVGPGAHSHVGGVRWWNVKHPDDVCRAAGRRGVAGCRSGDAHRGAAPRRGGAARCAAARRPSRRRAARRRAGRPSPGSSPTGCVDGPRRSGTDRRAVLTRQGRLLADTVVRRLLGLTLRPYFTQSGVIG